jgi:hypothetical protein
MTVLAHALSTMLALAPPEGLVYEARLRLMGRPQPLKATLQVETIPALVTRNRVRRPRLGTWKLSLRGTPPDVSAPLLLARLERLLYLSGPVPGMAPLGRGQWTYHCPRPQSVTVRFVEVSRGLLALSRLDGVLTGLGFESVDLRLVRVHLPRKAGPVEAGTALIGTLQRQTQAPSQAEERID